MVKVENLHKSFSVKHVLCEVGIEVRDDETFVIIGSSGTGKSVLLKNIVGLMKPDTGSIKID
ncbi:hypothetical protein ATZ36_14040 [Candidatus Endomicrobiellum trichonymphae]|jgi:phospholipid/cholesterol/gamma-HCH transport system ATP-binding protein|uniref:ABC transporter domain-containing protein n=1 Tax=Endomicrobium trichonymphae TaxID=1408204 RepID=A0A1E5IM55_ENDTX|nr:hypothetical protein ATZ36_14040 [Candidatus Endomicrobium trichonymphae]